MIMFKIFLILFVIAFIILMLLIMGETYAMNNTHPRFTMWWRKHVIGNKE